eukprot:s1717_g10.t1
MEEAQIAAAPPESSFGTLKNEAMVKLIFLDSIEGPAGIVSVVRRSHLLATCAEVRAMNSFQSLSLLQPSLKPSELLTFEDLSCVKPEELTEKRKSWIGQKILLEVSESSDFRMSFDSWTEYGPEDPATSPNRVCHEESKKEVEIFMQLSSAKPARLRQWVKQKRAEGDAGDGERRSCFNAMLAFMRGAP